MDGEENSKTRARATRLWNVLRFVVVMLRKGIAAKRLQKLAMDVHMAIRSLHLGGEDHFFSNSNNKSIARFNNHYEFSCSSTPMVKRAAEANYYGGLRRNSSGRRWDQRLLMATMPCIVKEAESVIHSTIPKFIECGEDYFNLGSEIVPSKFASTTPPPPSRKGASKASSTSPFYARKSPSTEVQSKSTSPFYARKSPLKSMSPFYGRKSPSSQMEEIDKQAEEFIASFYDQMRLQRQDSFTKYIEMLDRGSG